MERDQYFAPNPVYRRIYSETAGAVKDVIYCGESPEFHAILRYPDTDMLLTAAPKAISSGSSGVHWLFRPEGTTTNTRAGASLSALRGFKLLFAPRAPLAHPMVLFYNAVPLLDEVQRIPFGWNEEYALAVTFIATPDSSGRCYDTGLRANLLL